MTTVPSATRVSTCRACGSRDLTDLFSLGTQFVSTFPLPEDVHAPDQVPIELTRCSTCTLVQQRWSAPAELLYSRHYWYRSGTTDTMRRALADVVDHAMGLAKLEPGDVVLDIGSNDGTLLRQYPEELGLVRVGVEPANNFADSYRDTDILFVNDFWTLENYNTSEVVRKTILDRGRPGKDGWTTHAKVITACGMLYDLEDPTSFIRDVARVLHPDGVFVAQLQCLRQTVNLRDVGNYCHEHLEFYTLHSLVELFFRAGLRVVDVTENDVNGGSYRLTARRTETVHYRDVSCSVHDYDFRERSEGLHEVTTLVDHGRAMLDNMRRLRDLVTDLTALGKTIWVYGASTKGNTILQTAGLDRQLIKAAADRSAEKVGRVTVGTGIPIRSEADFRAESPDYAVVLPYTFLREFEEREREWRRRGGKWIIPIPDVKVV